eukprot:TRINITY_DN3652_c0_g1_i1.p1 TRINITY_DN3652_c0_g1~~TRINITY_DN3652_c0_g1_i1.p1  ORF type:complete len:335 (-),score=67.29 TRINITY_DN3652_c0_g1_i1:20-1024(-)
MQEEYEDIIEKTKEIIKEKIEEKDREKESAIFSMREEFSLERQKDKKELQEAFQEKLKVLERELSEKTERLNQQEKCMAELRMTNASLREELASVGYELDLVKSEREIQVKKMHSLEKRLSDLLKDRTKGDSLVKLQQKYKQVLHTLKETKNKMSELNISKENLKSKFIAFKQCVISNISAVCNFIVKSKLHNHTKVKKILTASSFTLSIIPEKIDSCSKTKEMLKELCDRYLAVRYEMTGVKEYMKSRFASIQNEFADTVLSIGNECDIRLLAVKEKYRERVILLYNKVSAENKNKEMVNSNTSYKEDKFLSLIHICRCRRSTLCRSRWSPYH